MKNYQILSKNGQNLILPSLLYTLLLNQKYQMSRVVKYFPPKVLSPEICWCCLLSQKILATPLASDAPVRKKLNFET